MKCPDGPVCRNKVTVLQQPVSHNLHYILLKCTILLIFCEQRSQGEAIGRIPQVRPQAEPTCERSDADRVWIPTKVPKAKTPQLETEG